MSAISASSMPQPTAAPFTAAITGTSVDSRRVGCGGQAGRRIQALCDTVACGGHDLLDVVA